MSEFLRRGPTTSPRAAEAARKRERVAAAQYTEDLRWFLGGLAGRRLAWRWIESSGMFAGSMTGNSETFFREGRRSIGLELLQDLVRAVPGGAKQMFAEHAFPMPTDGPEEGEEQETGNG